MTAATRATPVKRAHVAGTAADRPQHGAGLASTRLCTACGLVKPTLQFSGASRMCSACQTDRLWGGSPRQANGDPLEPIARTRRRAPRKRAPAQPISNATMRGLYDGAELRDYQGRPGAMDAFALPSRHLGKRYWRDGRVLNVAD